MRHLPWVCRANKLHKICHDIKEKGGLAAHMTEETLLLSSCFLLCTCLPFYQNSCYNFFFFVVQQPSSGLGHLTVEASRSHTFRHTQMVEL